MTPRPWISCCSARARPRPPRRPARGRSSTGSGRRCRSGADSRSPTWPRACSSRTPCPRSNRSGYGSWNGSATSNWPPGTAIRSSSTCTRAHAGTRCANASPSSSSRPSTAPDGRPRRSPSTARCATGCATNWASTRARGCGDWNSPSCAPRTWPPPRRSPRGRWPRPRSPRCPPERPQRSGRARRCSPYRPSPGARATVRPWPHGSPPPTDRAWSSSRERRASANRHWPARPRTRCRSASPAGCSPSTWPGRTGPPSPWRRRPACCRSPGPGGG